MPSLKFYLSLRRQQKKKKKKMENFCLVMLLCFAISNTHPPGITHDVEIKKEIDESSNKIRELNSTPALLVNDNPQKE